MDVILDESSLAPCVDWSPARRIEILGSALKALGQIGCSHILRSVRGAADMDIGEYRGLREWCFDCRTDHDLGRFVAWCLNKQPFIDGADGLFAAAEGERAIEGKVCGTRVVGLTFAALTGAPALALGSTVLPSCTSVTVELVTLDVDGEFQEKVNVCCLVTEDDVRQQSNLIINNLEQSVLNGVNLLDQADTLFQQLRFGPRAIRQIKDLNGNEPVFHQLFRHLRALNNGAITWPPEGVSFSPADAISWSREDIATLSHGVYGPQRDFPMPNGFRQRRWSCHTKLSGGAGARLYFDAERIGGTAVVLIGYFGDHLPSVQFPS